MDGWHKCIIHDGSLLVVGDEVRIVYGTVFGKMGGDDEWHDMA